MKVFINILIIAAIFSSVAFSQTKRSTSQEAEKWAKKAVAFFKAEGKEKAIAEFSDPKGKFVKDDLYITMYDFTGKCLANGQNSKMIGKDLIGLKDADGKAFIAERIQIAKTKGKGTQNYKWLNSETKAIEAKTMYVEKVEDCIIGCGSYKK